MEVLRVGFLADVQNLYQSSREVLGTNVAYDKLLRAAVRNRTLYRAYAYVIDGDTDQTSFVRVLDQLDFTVRRKRLIRRSDGSAKGNWDVGIAIDMVRLIQPVDVICLASGDGDFVPAVEYAQHHAVQVEVYGFRQCTSQDLIAKADRFYPLDHRVAYGDRK